MDNATMTIWSKNGSLLAHVDLNLFFGVPSGFFFSDPRVLYDNESGRWFESGFAFDQSHDTAAVLAVSASSDPSGQWFIYAPLVSQTGTTLQIDQPMTGVSSDKVVVAWNDFNTTGFADSRVLVLQKSDVVGGGTVRGFIFPPITNIFRLVPAQSVTPTSTEWLAFDNTRGTTIGVVSVTGTPANSNMALQQFSLSAAGTSTPPQAPQGGSAALINTDDDRFLSAVWQNNHLWVSGNDACTPAGDTAPRSCMKLMEVDTTPATPSLIQDFDGGVAGSYVYYPAVAVDGSGDLFVVYSQSNGSTFPQVAATAQPVNGAARTLEPSLTLQTGNGPYNPVNQSRWGDYSGAATDPSDPSRVWVAGEYAHGINNGDWGTAGAELFLQPAISSVAPSSGAFVGGDTVTITGQDLLPGATVKFGNNAATGVTVTSSTQLTATAPPGYGKVDVTVTNPGGASTTASGAYTYALAPNVKYFTWYDVLSTGFSADNIHVVNPGSSTATVVVNIPGQPGCTPSRQIPAGKEEFFNCPTGYGGPVTVSSDLPVLASQRVVYGQTFNEVVAQDASTARTALDFTWFDIRSTGFKADNIHVLNPGATTANVTVKIPGCMSPLTGSIGAGQEQYFSCNGYGGPVQVTSDQPVLASQRVVYGQSFNEELAQDPSAGQTTLYFTWFDIRSTGFQADNIHVLNPGTTTANVTVNVPGCTSPLTGSIAAGQEQYFSCNGYGGPVQVTSDVPVLASQRVLYGQSFNEVLAQDPKRAQTTMYFTWFDRQSTGFAADNVHILNPGTVTANVSVQIPGCTAAQTGSIPAGQESYFSCASGYGGPVKVASDQPVLASQRVLYYQSFNEVLGLIP